MWAWFPRQTKQRYQFHRSGSFAQTETRGCPTLPQLPGPGAGIGVANSLNYVGGGGYSTSNTSNSSNNFIGNSPPSMQISQAPRMVRRYDHLPSIWGAGQGVHPATEGQKKKKQQNEITISTPTAQQQKQPNSRVLLTRTADISTKTIVASRSLILVPVSNNKTSNKTGYPHHKSTPPPQQQLNYTALESRHSLTVPIKTAAGRLLVGTMAPPSVHQHHRYGQKS